MRESAFVWSLLFLGLTVLFFRIAIGLFRSGLRRGGMVAAVVGMVLLGVVIFSFLPVLFRNAFGDSLSRGKFRITAGGWVFLLLVILLSLAAVNTGNNLLYMLLAFLVAAIAVSGSVSRMMLRKTSVILDLPDGVYAGEKIDGRIGVTNAKRIAYTYSLGTVCRLVNDTVAEAALPGYAEGGRVSLRKLDSAGIPVTTIRAFSPVVPAGGTEFTPISFRIAERGRYRLVDSELVTTFPFGFFRKSRLLQGKGEILVYPCPAEADEVEKTVEARWEDKTVHRKGHGSEMFALRDYNPGEDIRLIHWKVTARTGHLTIRDFATDGRERARVLLDQVLPPGEPVLSPRFERALSILTGFILDVHEAGGAVEVLFSHPDEGETVSEEDAYQLLQRLATARPILERDGGEAHPFTDPDFLRDCESGEQAPFILFSFRHPGAFPALKPHIGPRVGIGDL